jgi:O-methyltransferase involved in polyketide biosynthesis
MYYLPRESIVETLRFVAGQHAQAGVVFDFAVAPECVAEEHRHLLKAFLEFNRTAPESWQSWFAPEAIRALLQECGFREVALLDHAEIERRYLAGRPDGMLTSPLIGLVAASV